MAALSEREKKYCDAYLVHFNGTRACIEAGYSKNSAHTQSTRLLKKANIQKYLAEKKKKVATRLEISQKRTLTELGRIAFSDIRNYFNEDGSLKKLHELSEEAAAAVSMTEVELRPGNVVKGKSKDVSARSTTTRIKLWNKEKALEMLAKHFHIFEEIKPDGETHNHFDLSKVSKDDLKVLLKLLTKKG